MRRLSFLSLAAILAIVTPAVMFAMAIVAVNRLMGWAALWAFLDSHRTWPVSLSVVLFINCVFIPGVAVYAAKTKRDEEDETVKPLLRWQNGIGRREP